LAPLWTLARKSPPQNYLQYAKKSFINFINQAGFLHKTQKLRVIIKFVTVACKRSIKKTSLNLNYLKLKVDKDRKEEEAPFF